MFKILNIPWIKTLLFLSVLLLLLHLNKKLDRTPYHEGFTQNEKFVTKHQCDVYDDFYATIYDQLNDTKTRVDKEVNKIIEMTQPSKKHTAFLDVGSGTGYTMKFLQNKGYQVYGIEKSAAMVEFSQQKHPDLDVKCGDILEPMAYDRGTFTHVLCTYFTIYQFQDKVAFFRNCYYWLKPGGFLILHLVDRDRFDPILPGGKPTAMSNPQRYSISRITDTMIDFIDFKYRASYDFSSKNKNQVVFTEKFTDDLTSNVRQNEQTLYMETVENILYTAQYCGFIPHGKSDLSSLNGDPHQYIYILERAQ